SGGCRDSSEGGCAPLPMPPPRMGLRRRSRRPGGGLGGGRRGPRRPMSALVEIREVSKAFGGVQAVTKVSLDVQTGEIFSVSGPNGAGKTTVLNMISGFY